MSCFALGPGGSFTVTYADGSRTARSVLVAARARAPPRRPGRPDGVLRAWLDRVARARPGVADPRIEAVLHRVRDGSGPGSANDSWPAGGRIVTG
ncbi:hypothetical protein [Pseudonocardia sp. H11422]|uniref:hypothetical protein n=1 Tax=Pseudonocardia sp. H11422 TaxID=2835866 RepID=UPI001BDCD5E2|nr:hypothetical protein [Pseudonocardia sp. H11422]